MRHGTGGSWWPKTRGSALRVIPVGAARIDAAYLTCILESRTVGELRRNPPAWRVATEHRDNALEEETDPASALLDDRTPYDPSEWFGGDGTTYAVPLGRLRTAQRAPPVLDS